MHGTVWRAPWQVVQAGEHDPSKENLEIVSSQLHAFLEQILVDVNDAAAGENILELVALQLVVEGRADVGDDLVVDRQPLPRQADAAGW